MDAPVPQRVREFIGRHIVPPELVFNPETGSSALVPARYSFSGPHAGELERIARAASAASGIVDTPEDLTAAAEAQMAAAQEAAAGGGR